MWRPAGTEANRADDVATASSASRNPPALPALLSFLLLSHHWAVKGDGERSVYSIWGTGFVIYVLIFSSWISFSQLCGEYRSSVSLLSS